MDASELFLVERLRVGDNDAYRSLFEDHYAVLCHIAARYVGDDFMAESIVGDVMFHVWEIRESLDVQVSLRSYLMRCVRNRCLNYMQTAKVRATLAGPVCATDSPAVRQLQRPGDSPLGRLLEKELEDKIAQAVSSLPADCRRVFMMSRFDGKTNSLIAEELGITVNTVKYHIRHALALLRQSLQGYLKGASVCFVLQKFLYFSDLCG